MTSPGNRGERRPHRPTLPLLKQAWAVGGKPRTSAEHGFRGMRSIHFHEFTPGTPFDAETVRRGFRPRPQGKGAGIGSVAERPVCFGYPTSVGGGGSVGRLHKVIVDD